jgi:hypothetical protein
MSVLAGQAQYHAANVAPGGGAARTFLRIGLPTSNQTPVPTQQGRWRYEEDAPGRARQQPRQRGQQDSIPVAQVGPVYLTAQDGNLVTERQDLDLLSAIITPEQDQEPEHAADDEVQHRPWRVSASTACSWPRPQVPTWTDSSAR